MLRCNNLVERELGLKLGEDVLDSVHKLIDSRLDHLCIPAQCNIDEIYQYACNYVDTGNIDAAP